ncbi:undecaprenyl-diphosphate phosphatase [Actinomycetospora chiangmaiensis]|uniref:undecaprenyl-diphosphate phosphatase n=1 Tax=Actinomycetospora chiangmaiensis TaxID=402650 RepID=UPI000477BA4F|nr:undecaprenyl-diphosphate phosphatase [Actinomycetospora chiangmaiensis]
MSAHLSWLEAAVIGALQGVAELFPVSSLGHSILLPAVIGGSWARDLDVTAKDSPYLAFVVGLHVATALAMIVYFWRDWVRILTGLVTSIRDRRVATDDQRLAWMLVLATIPVGLAGLVLDQLFRTLLAKPVPTAAFLVANGVLLIAVEQLARRRAAPAPAPGPAAASVDAPTVRLDAPTQVMRGGSVGVAAPTTAEEQADARLARLPLLTAVLIGASQILALLPGISRSGATIGTGLLSKLSHEDAARFAFLLATPVILAAGVLKLPELFGPAGDGIRGQVLLGSVLSGVGAYVSVRFLTRYFEHRSMRPFGVYCIVAGAACLAWFSLS